jgi:hypothetical protein
LAWVGFLANGVGKTGVLLEDVEKVVNVVRRCVGRTHKGAKLFVRVLELLVGRETGERNAGEKETGGLVRWFRGT